MNAYLHLRIILNRHAPADVSGILLACMSAGIAWDMNDYQYYEHKGEVLLLAENINEAEQSFYVESLEARIKELESE